MVLDRYVSLKVTKIIIGGLNHVGKIIPMGPYFINLHRYRHKQCGKHRNQKLVEWEIADLKLWLDMLIHTSLVEISINNITYTMPTDVGMMEEYKTELGGFSDNGMTWRWSLPLDMHRIFLINLLEFIYAVVNIWYMTILNSSILDWLYKLSLNPVIPDNRRNFGMSRSRSTTANKLVPCNLQDAQLKYPYRQQRQLLPTTWP